MKSKSVAWMTHSTHRYVTVWPRSLFLNYLIKKWKLSLFSLQQALWSRVSKDRLKAHTQQKQVKVMDLTATDVLRLKKSLKFQMTAFCDGLRFFFFFIVAAAFPYTGATAKLDGQLVILGRAGEQQQRVKPRGHELTHQERTNGRATEGKRKVIWEEGTWSTDTEMEERRGKGGRRGRGQKGDTPRQRERGRERWRKGWGIGGMLLIH